ncbi:MAG: LysR family transcriptional regulator [Gammaproteobacteria bacterium]
MDIAALDTFVTVARCASFSEAAHQLHLTQPAISKRIAALETELGTRLFDRVGRQIALTEAGRALLPRAERILEELADSRRALSNLSGEVSGRLTIATSHHLGLHRMPPVLRRFMARYPRVELDLQFRSSESICSDVEHGSLEIGIVTLPPIPNENLLVETIWEDRLRIVCAKDHPLVAEALDGLEALGRYPAILTEKGTFTRELLEAAFRPLGIPIRAKLATNFLETIKMMVSVGLGWSCIPEIMVTDDLAILDSGEFNLSRQLGIVRHPHRTLSNAARAMRGLLKES